MKLKALSVAAAAAMAVTALAAANASATTLEINGVTQNKAVTIKISLKAGTEYVISTTAGTLANACTGSTAEATTETFSGTTLTGQHTTFSVGPCPRILTTHKLGKVHFEHIAGTTNAKTRFSSTEWTVGTPFGTVTCKTGEGTEIGTLTGVASGEAELDVNAVLNCGFVMPSASWKARYVFTSPKGLGVSA